MRRLDRGEGWVGVVTEERRVGEVDAIERDRDLVRVRVRVRDRMGVRVRVRVRIGVRLRVRVRIRVRVRARQARVRVRLERDSYRHVALCGLRHRGAHQLARAHAKRRREHVLAVGVAPAAERVVELAWLGLGFGLGLGLGLGLGSGLGLGLGFGLLPWKASKPLPLKVIREPPVSSPPG